MSIFEQHCLKIIGTEDELLHSIHVRRVLPMNRIYQVEAYYILNIPHESLFEILDTLLYPLSNCQISYLERAA